MSSQDSGHLRVLSIGAGAIGTYIGGSLALNGSPVTFIEQPGAAEELRQTGLRLKIGDQEHCIPSPRVASSPEEALQHGPYDVGIFALKSFDTLSAAKTLSPYHEHLPPILCLQNGVENEAVLAELLGEDKVIPGTLTSAVGRRGVGNIQLERKRGLGVAASHPLARQLAEALDSAGLNARLYSRAADMKWSKMLTNLLGNATSAILNMSPTEIFSNPALCRLEIEQIREALRVMDAQNITTVDLPGTPVRALTFSVRRLPLSLTRLVLIKGAGSGRGGKMPSFHIDLHAGRGQTEVDFLNGAVVRFGERLSIPTPVNRLLNQTLQDLATGRQPLETYQRNPEALLRKLRKQNG